VRSGTPLATRT
ncbi:hypothetical protein VCHENC02_1965B, partial [Vibrio harveyi]